MKICAKYDDLAGRRALVTGGSGGLGLGIAEAMLDQGMSVCINYRSNETAADALAARYPGRAMAVGADLGTERGCVTLVKEAVALLGGVEHVVHSAGLWNAGPIASISRETLEEMFRVNTFSAFYLVREALPWLRAGSGTVVFIGSTAGQRGEAGHGHYAASKGALQSLAMSLAVELAPAVRVNLVSPGWIATPMTAQAMARIGATVAATLPNKRLGEIEDVAHAVLFLTSRASSHLLGQDLGVSGGALLVVPRGQLVPAPPGSS